MNNANQNDGRVKLVMILKHFHHLRELEISNLWTRSIFLSVFISMIFTSYGFVLFKIIEPDINCGSPFIYNMLAFLICVIGLIFSEIWIMMAKGSKAWCEIYEKRIKKIEKEIIVDNIWRYNYKGQDIMPNINNCILSTKAGAYSPSRINIFIGIVMFFIWLVPSLTHFVIIIVNLTNAKTTLCEKTLSCCIVFLFAIIIAFCLYFAAHKIVKSKHIKNYLK